VPKRSRIEELAEDVPLALEQTLNFRPRKTLGFRTPHEIFFEEEVSLLDDQLMHFCTNRVDR
jgi:IS30 family transposase